MGTPLRFRARGQDRLFETFDQAAGRILAELHARHLPFGLIADPIFAAPQSDEIVAYTRMGDAAIWTGHYLAAETFRYVVTGSLDAAANARQAVESIQDLVAVTGTNLLARARLPADSPFAARVAQEEEHNGVYARRLGERDLLWLANTSRDQYLGVFFGLSAAHQWIPDAKLRDSIRDVVTKMLDFLAANNWGIALPNGQVNNTFSVRADQLLSLLQVGRQVNPERFDSTYRNQRFWLSLNVVIPITFDVLDEHSSYFKFNLNLISLFNLIRLEGEGVHRNRYSDAYAVLRRTIDDHGNAHFNMIDRALWGPDERRDRETVHLLRAWLRRPRRDFFVDLRNSVAACGDNRACQPIPVEHRVLSDFVWQRSPFQLYGGGNGFIENAGLDFLLPYWMGRAYGLL